MSEACKAYTSSWPQVTHNPPLAFGTVPLLAVKVTELAVATAVIVPTAGAEPTAGTTVEP